MAARRHGAEKPHQGVSTRKRASHQGFARRKSNTALGLRAGCAGNRVRSFCSGEQYDSDLGLYYLRARYYNPATGRFLSRDPEEGKAYDPQSLHKYLYAGGDPVNRVDPRGRADSADYSSLLANETWKTKLEMRASAYAVRVFLCVAEVLSIIYGPDVPEFGRENILEECMEQEL
jgi:RHS repeat-associated protein